MSLLKYIGLLIVGFAAGGAYVFQEIYKPAVDRYEAKVAELDSKAEALKGSLDAAQDAAKRAKADLEKARKGDDEKLAEAKKSLADLQKKIAGAEDKPAEKPSEAAAGSATSSASADAEQKALQSVVLIKGDNGQGTGFLVKTADGPCVITNLHVLFDNPNVKITTTGGDTIATAGLKGASDRDLAMIAIEDKGYKYLDYSTDVAKEAQIDDDLMTPGNSKGGEVILPTRGKLLATGTQRVEFDNPIYHGNSGGPVFDLKIGKVIGVVSQAEKVATSNDLDKASFSNKNSAITKEMRYFGFRIDTVPQWEAYDWPQFLAEGKRIDDFHDRTAALHSFLASVSEKKNPNIDTTLFMQDEPIRLANLEWQSQIDRNPPGSSTRQRATEQLVVTLRNLADAQYDDLDRSRFYTYDATCAKDELAYRKSIKDAIDHISEIINH
ncbi:MAG TPA: trypsin-like peptidase domain-containing protein [Candidatus Methylacidiphilales bacterium]